MVTEANNFMYFNFLKINSKKKTWSVWFLTSLKTLVDFMLSMVSNIGKQNQKSGSMFWWHWINLNWHQVCLVIHGLFDSSFWKQYDIKLCKGKANWVWSFLSSEILWWGNTYSWVSVCLYQVYNTSIWETGSIEL